MKAMDRIRNIARRNFSSLTQQQIADMVGISRQSVYRFLSGRDGSIAIAEFMAKKYGGQCQKLLEAHLRELCEVKQQRMEHARKHIENGRYFDRVVPRIETHRLSNPATLPPHLQKFCGYLELVA